MRFISLTVLLITGCQLLSQQAAQKRLLLKNHLYEPILLELINPQTQRVERKALEPHQEVYFEDMVPKFIAVMRDSPDYETIEVPDDQKEIVPIHTFPPYVEFIHITRNRSSLSGLACHYANARISILRKALLAEKVRQAQSLQQEIQSCDDEKEWE